MPGSEVLRQLRNRSTCPSRGSFSPGQAQIHSPSKWPDPAAWAAYAGRYAGDDTLTIWVSGGRLMVHSANEGVEMPSVALSNTRFACDVGLIEFQVATDGHVPAIKFGRVYTLLRE